MTWSSVATETYQTLSALEKAAIARKMQEIRDNLGGMVGPQFSTLSGKE